MRTLAALLLFSTATAQTASVAEVTSGSETAVLGVGARVRYITLPEWFHGMYSDESVALHSAAFGAEITWRRSPDFDWLFGIEYGLYSPPDGNWLGNGKNARTKTDYIHFDGVNVISIDATAVWNTRFSRWFTLTYGAGLGIGIVTGEMIRAPSLGCNADNLEDQEACHPPDCDADGDYRCSEEELAAMRERELDPANDPVDAQLYDPDDPGEPGHAAFVEGGVPPVLPVLHALVGARFTLHRNFELRIDGGFHNAFFLGAAGQYLF